MSYNKNTIYKFMLSNNQNNQRAKRLTIGVLVGRLDEGYQQDICSALNKYAEEKDINMIYYAGRPINYPGKFEALCNSVFELISPGMVDGLILLTGTLCGFIDLNKSNAASFSNHKKN